MGVIEQQSTTRRFGRARSSPVNRQREIPHRLELGPILHEQLEYLIDNSAEETDRYERVATILMERFQ
jgi:hypothetical protein